MRNLADKYYAALTPSERVGAAIEAAARDDTLEIQRLRETCPRGLYRQTDPIFSDSMEQLSSLCVAVRHDQMVQVARYLIGRQHDRELAQDALQSLASLEAGLKDIFDELGVAGDAADSFFKPHPVLEEVYPG
jgi:hypothetical protein